MSSVISAIGERLRRDADQGDRPKEIVLSPEQWEALLDEYRALVLYDFPRPTTSLSVYGPLGVTVVRPLLPKCEVKT